MNDVTLFVDILLVNVDKMSAITINYISICFLLFHVFFTTSTISPSYLILVKTRTYDEFPSQNFYMIFMPHKYITSCEGGFCNGATRRAESDHDVDLNLKRG